ncbi:MAG: hypothetical protein BWY63_03073 [Chloroflexi bacterium ADurb.Bin360]|nr:MAG: hypothetical protein BWY63_03073 [Chloroflexi bacterium ADurb.Bin360]
MPHLHPLQRARFAEDLQIAEIPAHIHRRIDRGTHKGELRSPTVGPVVVVADGAGQADGVATATALLIVTELHLVSVNILSFRQPPAVDRVSGAVIVADILRGIRSGSQAIGCAIGCAHNPRRAQLTGGIECQHLDIELRCIFGIVTPNPTLDHALGRDQFVGGAVHQQQRTAGDIHGAIGIQGGPSAHDVQGINGPAGANPVLAPAQHAIHAAAVVGEAQVGLQAVAPRGHLQGNLGRRRAAEERHIGCVVGQLPAAFQVVALQHTEAQRGGGGGFGQRQRGSHRRFRGRQRRGEGGGKCHAGRDRLLRRQRLRWRRQGRCFHHCDSTASNR